MKQEIPVFLSKCLKVKKRMEKIFKRGKARETRRCLNEYGKKFFSFHVAFSAFKF